MKDFNEENAVILAEWIYNTFKYEAIDTITEVLSNPPVLRKENDNVETTWRLTPDTIQRWMDSQLEKEAIKRERENDSYKQSWNFESQHIKELPIDYESYKKRIEEGTALKDDPKRTGFDSPEYLAYKAERMKLKTLQNPNKNDTETPGN